MGSVEAAQARILATTPHGNINIQFRWRPFLDGITVLLAVASIVFAYVPKTRFAGIEEQDRVFTGKRHNWIYRGVSAKHSCDFHDPARHLR